jgi:hypothetical protein
VFCKTSQEAGLDPCEVASHECLELLCDQHVNLTAIDESASRLFAFEVGDPCQGNGYQIGKTGESLTVADFTLPNYFVNTTPSSAKTSYRGALSGPFSIAPQGYYSYIDLNNYKAGWQQKMGAERTSIPPEDRLIRRGVQ